MRIPAQVGLAMLSGFGGVGLAVAADQSPVATVVRVDGTAVVSQDARYVPARQGMNLKEGDRLMVLEGGSAILTFTDGCQYELGQMAMLAVQGISTCAANGVGVYKVDPKTAVADGAVPKPKLAAIGGNGKKARSKAQCDAAAKNANPNDDCDCEERRNNSDKDDDCPPVAAIGGGAAVAGAGTAGGLGAAGLAAGGLVTAGVAAVAVGTVAVLASESNDNNNQPAPPVSQ
ncbi:MAG: hypothetical protein WCF05_02980 [Chromatiaceae bacterium]